jgi:hypothetical protein
MTSIGRKKSATCCGAALRLGLSIIVTCVLATLPAEAVERLLQIDAPAAAAARASVQVTVRASTDAGASEQVGFLHIEYSVDDGKTWTALCFDQNLGGAVVRTLQVPTGVAGKRTIIRARAAYRGGVAGDVDYRGGAIQWQTSWESWDEPPARTAVIKIGR